MTVSLNISIGHKTIKLVVAKIGAAGQTRGQTQAAFDAIEKQVAQVTRHGADVFKVTDTMNSGTFHIRDAMNSLNADAKSTTGEAERIADLTNALQGLLSEVGRISAEVVSNIGEITQGLAEMSRTTEAVSAQAERLEHVGDEIDASVRSFQIQQASGA